MYINKTYCSMNGSHQLVCTVKLLHFWGVIILYLVSSYSSCHGYGTLFVAIIMGKNAHDALSGVGSCL